MLKFHLLYMYMLTPSYQNKLSVADLATRPGQMNQQTTRVMCAEEKIQVNTNMAEKRKICSLKWSKRDKAIIVQND